MSLPVEALELEVLRLPAAERERLLDRVIASLDADKDRDKAWDNLAAKRDTEIERGESTPVSGPEVIARLRAELSRSRAAAGREDRGSGLEGSRRCLQTRGGAEAP